MLNNEKTLSEDEIMKIIDEKYGGIENANELLCKMAELIASFQVEHKFSFDETMTVVETTLKMFQNGDVTTLNRYFAILRESGLDIFGKEVKKS